jgi:hypothetical protein
MYEKLNAKDVISILLTYFEPFDVSFVRRDFHF